MYLLLRSNVHNFYKFISYHLPISSAEIILAQSYTNVLKLLKPYHIIIIMKYIYNDSIILDFLQLYSNTSFNKSMKNVFVISSVRYDVRVK